MDAALFNALVGVLGVPGALLCVILIVAAGLWIKRNSGGSVPSGNGGATREGLGQLKGVLDGIARSQEQLAAALRELTHEHAESRLVVSKVGLALEAFVIASVEYQKAGRAAMEKIDDVFQAVSSDKGGRRPRRR